MKLQVLALAVTALSGVACSRSDAKPSKPGPTCDPGPCPPDCSCVPKVTQKDIAYSSTYATDRVFDFYPTCKRNPVIVYVHGGGWAHGDKSVSAATKTVIDRLRNNGYNVVSAGYRLTNGATPPLANTFPAQVNDIKCLYNFLAASGGTYGNTSRLSGWGHSAGAHLTLMATLTGPTDFYADCDSSASYTVRRVAVTSAPIDLTKYTTGSIGPTRGLTGIEQTTTVPSEIQALKDASPLYYATAGDPAVLMLTGTDDTLVTPSDNSGQLEAAFAALGRSDEWIDYAGVTHDGVVSHAAAMDEIVDFFPVLDDSVAKNEAGCPSSF